MQQHYKYRGPEERCGDEASLHRRRFQGAKLWFLDVMEPRSERRPGMLPDPAVRPHQLQRHGQRQVGWTLTMGFSSPGGGSMLPPAGSKAFPPSSSTGWTWASPWTSCPICQASAGAITPRWPRRARQPQRTTAGRASGAGKKGY